MKTNKVLCLSDSFFSFSFVTNKIHKYFCILQLFRFFLDFLENSPTWVCCRVFWRIIAHWLINDFVFIFSNTLNTYAPLPSFPFLWSTDMRGTRLLRIRSVQSFLQDWSRLRTEQKMFHIRPEIFWVLSLMCFFSFMWVCWCFSCMNDGHLFSFSPASVFSSPHTLQHQLTLSSSEHRRIFFRPDSRCRTIGI